jgi:hypothetical protein
MRFWRLRAPDYSSDYAHTFINGELDHPFALPGVECERCGATWGGHKILPFELPEVLRSIEILTDGRPISGAAHRELRAKVLSALQDAGAPITHLEVGAIFQPGFLDVPSRPEADFLWSGIGSPVISKRVRDLIEAAHLKGCVCVPVVPRKIGKRRAKLPARVPSSGQPEDLITEMQDVLRPSAAPVYYELVVTAESKHPPGASRSAICELCGREEFDHAGRQLVMTPDMWQGDDVFLLATTLWPIVTDSTKDLLMELRPTDVVFSPVDVLRN